MALAQTPRCLLLDEPLAGMGHEESARIVDLLRGLKGAMRDAAGRARHGRPCSPSPTASAVLVQRARRSRPATPDAVRADPAVRAAYLGEETRRC